MVFKKRTGLLLRSFGRNGFMITVLSTLSQRLELLPLLVLKAAFHLQFPSLLDEDGVG
jgi:hypothetical protein